MKSLTLIALFFSTLATAQYVPIISQYMFNDVILNPANTGNKEALSLFGSYRAQWVGIPGAPMTQSFVAHSPLRNKSSAVGIQCFSDQIGVDKTTAIFGSYAYRINMPSMRLSFGLSAGVNLIKSSNTQLQVNDQGDGLLTDSPLFIIPDVSFGMALNSKKYFVSFSLPMFLGHKENNGKYRLDHDVKNYNFMLGGGYKLILKNEKTITPSLLLKYKVGGRPQADINVIFDIHKVFDVGFSYRTEEAVIALFKITPGKQFSVMYSFGMPITPISYKQFGSHEIGLEYNFLYPSKSTNPRYLTW
ncbi:MAG: type IX secretion system membrane protein PorP/SprF [Crocinitomicaceae bacterium]